MRRFLCTLLMLCCASALAGPVRPVRSTTFSTPAPAPNGPPPDIAALQGQWFIDTATAIETPSAWEFHDEDLPYTIAGQVVNIIWGTNVTIVGYTNILGFRIEASVQNNLPDQMAAGVASNSHSEVQTPPQPIYPDIMKRPRIAAEFAVAEAGLGGPPWVGVAPDPLFWQQSGQGMAPPYYADPGSGGSYVIEAQGEPLAAWYCFEQPLPDNPQNPPGAYYVPAWELEDIPPGESRSVLMDFMIKGYGGGYAEMPPTDLRYSVIKASYDSGFDVLYNRAVSLKISHWIDYILIDNYTNGMIQSVWDPFLEEELQTNDVYYISASDASVFFDTALPGEEPILQISSIATNQTPDAVILDWTAMDAVDYEIQYRDILNTNIWYTAVTGTGYPTNIPGPMQWTDDGTVITNLPVWQQPQRFYRLFAP